MKRQFVFFVCSLFFSFALCSSCKGVDDMTEAYDAKFSDAISSESSATDSSFEYVPGYYKLPSLITESSYNIFVGQKSSYKIEVRSSGLRNYNYWLSKQDTTMLGYSILNSDGEREMDGGLSSSNAVCYILPSVTKSVTSEDPENLNDQLAYIFTCHAFNAYGDEYWDEALIHVIPVQALEWYTTDGTLDAEGTNANMVTVTGCSAVELDSTVSFNDIDDLKVRTKIGVNLKTAGAGQLTFTSYTPGTLTIIVWNENVKNAVQPTVTGKTHAATLRKYSSKNSTGLTTYTIAFEGADTWTISNESDTAINPIVYIKAQMTLTGAVE